ncbi:MAG: hypothetical protein IJU98_11465 [Synergistaceae bacterium]|nr:hypothetical protein [Synergistaceae bacterium]
MLTQELEIKGGGEEFRLVSHADTDDAERLNWETAQANGKGFIRRGGDGEVQGRLVAQIPPEEAAMLEARYDLDWLAFTHNRDRAAFRRLLKRFPHWRCCEGGV